VVCVERGRSRVPASDCGCPRRSPQAHMARGLAPQTSDSQMPVDNISTQVRMTLYFHLVSHVGTAGVVGAMAGAENVFYFS
jgi:hypothetical protein